MQLLTVARRFWTTHAMLLPQGRRALPAVVAWLLLSIPSPARAEIVFFASGGSVSVKSYRLEHGTLRMRLRTGGEIACDPAVVMRIVPDEVVHPDARPLIAAGDFAESSLLAGAKGAAGQPGPPDVEEEGPVALSVEIPSQYETIIDDAAATHGVDPRLVRAVVQVESAFQARARSPKGAMGLMQLMPATARRYSVKNPYDPASNLDAGIRHLKSLLARFPLRLALAAYNAGEAAVERFGGVPPYPETRAYVARVLKLLRSA